MVRHGRISFPIYMGIPARFSMCAARMAGLWNPWVCRVGIVAPAVVGAVRVQCRLGMDYSQNGIFISLPGSLMAGRERQRAEGGAARILLTPDPLEHDPRRRGLDDQEVIKRAAVRPT